MRGSPACFTPAALNAASVEEHRRAAGRHAADKVELRRILDTISRAYDPCTACAVH